MLSKKEQSYFNDDQMEAYCRSISKYSDKGYKFYMSKTGKRTNSQSRKPGGSVVFTVDHVNKIEVAYPYIKNTISYVLKIYNEKDNESNVGYIKTLSEVYSGNHRDGKLDVYVENGLLLEHVK